MRKLFLAMTIAIGGFASAQNDAFSGKGDLKLDIGANFQSGGTGIMTSLDYGLGDSFSIGLQTGYLLGISEVYGEKSRVEHRFDLKARANAHLGEVIGLPANFDVYPGLNLGLKNFGAHAGARYFFKKGFGVFTEFQIPIAKYNTNSDNYRLLNNQFAVLAGVAFDL